MSTYETSLLGNGHGRCEDGMASILGNERDMGNAPLCCFAEASSTRQSSCRMGEAIESFSTTVLKATSTRTLVKVIAGIYT